MFRFLVAILTRPRQVPPRGYAPEGLRARRAWQVAVLCYPILVYLFPWLAIVAVVIFARRAACSVSPKSVGTGAFGTVTWAGQSDLEQASMLTDNGGLLLGRVAARPPSLPTAFFDLFLAPRTESREVVARFKAALLSLCYGKPPSVFANRFYNLVVVAPPGAGKGAAIIVSALLAYQKSVVVLDPKGENFTLTAKHRANALGHAVRRLDPFNVCGAGADAFNPLSALDPASPTLVDDCLALADALVVKTGQEHDPHWNESAIAAITAFILYVALYAPEENRTLNTVAELVTDPKEFQHAIGMMQDRDGILGDKFGRTHAYQSLRRYGNQLSALIDKELASVQSTINRHLAWTNSPLVQASISRSTFDLVDLARQKMTLYLVLPPDKLESHNRLMRLWITVGSRALVRNGLQEKSTVLFLLDEVGNCGQLKALREGVTMLRGYGARYAFILQSVAQFKEMFGESAPTVMAGFDYTVFFGLRDFASAKEMSERIGQTTVRSRSTGTSSSSTRPTWFPGSQGGGSATVTSGSSENWTETGRALILPDEILRERERTVFVLASGQNPIRVEQVRYYEDPDMAAAVASNRSASGSATSATPAAVSAHPLGALPGVPATPAPERIRFACVCKKRYNLASTMGGRRARCSLCSRVIVIPSMSTRTEKLGA